MVVPINKNLIKLGPTPERQPERQNGAKDKTPGWKVGEGGQSGGQRLTACLCRPSRAAAAWLLPPPGPLLRPPPGGESPSYQAKKLGLMTWGSMELCWDQESWGESR